LSAQILAVGLTAGEAEIIRGDDHHIIQVRVPTFWQCWGKNWDNMSDCMIFSLGDEDVT